MPNIKSRKRNVPGYLYLLEARRRQAYIGSSKRDPFGRIRKHCQGQGAEFTRKYSPRKLLGMWVTDNMKAGENILTEALSYQRGFENVRGGWRTALHSKDQIQSLRPKKREHAYIIRVQ